MEDSFSDTTLIDYNIHRRTYKTNDIHIPTLFDTQSKERFLNVFYSDENIDILSRMIMQRLDLHDKKMLYIVRIDVVNFITSWVNLGKFDEKYLIQTSSISNQVAYYNKLFVEVFEYDFRKKYQYTYDSNPFFEEINGKKREDFRPEDYAALPAQQTRVSSQRESVDKTRDTIRFYEKSLYKRHYDTNNVDIHSVHGNDRSALIYTDNIKYNDELDKIVDRSSNASSAVEKESLYYNRYSKKDLDALIK
jgi:hypothetical protein